MPSPLPACAMATTCRSYTTCQLDLPPRDVSLAKAVCLTRRPQRSWRPNHSAISRPLGMDARFRARRDVTQAQA
jgi:hypothetical protein